MICASLVTTGAIGAELDEIGRSLVPLIKQKAYSKIADRFCPDSVANYREWFPRDTEGQSDAILRSDVREMRVAFQFNLAVTLKESGVNSGSWTYLHTFYGKYPEDEWGGLTVTFSSDTNRLDLHFPAKMEGDSVVFMCAEAPDWELLWEYE